MSIAIFLRQHNKKFNKLIIAVYSLQVLLLFSIPFMEERPLDDLDLILSDTDPSALSNTITLESFDPDLKTLRLTDKPIGPLLFENSKDPIIKRLGIPEGEHWKTVPFQVGPLNVRDVGIDFRLYGIDLDYSDLGDQDVFMTEKEWSSHVPQAVKDIELTAEGDPRLYPFDKYLAIGRIDIPFRFIYQDQKAYVLSRHNEIKSHLSGFVVKLLSFDDLKQLSKNNKTAHASVLSAKLGDQARSKFSLSPEQAWIADRFAVEIRRPLLLRVLAIILMLTASVSTAWIAFRTEPKDYISTAAGYLVAMWAAKSIAGGQAPKVPSVMDYLIVFLFVFQAVTIALRAYRSTKAKPKRYGFGGGIPD